MMRGLGLLLLALLLQGCNSLTGENGQFRPALSATSSGGTPLAVNSSARFQGKIAFVRDHRLYVFNGTTGVITALPAGTGVSDPAYSPDGTRLAYIRQSAGWSDLLVLPAGGGAPSALTHSEGNGAQITCSSGIAVSDAIWVASPVWAADGATLYYLSDQQKLGAACGYSDMGIWKLPASGGTPALLLPPASGQDSSGLPGAGGDADLTLRPGSPSSLSYTHYAYDPQDGTSLLIQLFLATLDGQQELALSPASANQAPEQALEPAWSPDGGRLAFIRRDGARTDLLVLRPSDGPAAAPSLADYAAATKLLDGQIRAPVWSPDGKALLYLAFKDNEFNLYLAHLSITTTSITLQGNPIQLTQGGVDGDSRPAWTGD
jgi:Tol biopolymer transport system component